MKLKSLSRDKLFTVLRNLVVAEILAYLIFMMLALSANWGKIYRGYFLANYIRFEIVEFLLLGIFQLGLIIFVFIKSLSKGVDVGDLIKSGEHERLEFKTSLRWDSRLNQVNKELEKTVMKTIAAFLNSEGGQLLIGIDDKGWQVGLKNDFDSLPKPNADGFENHFNNLFNKMIGPEFRRLVKLTFNNFDDKTVCLVDIDPSHKPAYLKTGEEENFYIRTGNVTTSLKMSEAATYISSWRRMK